MGLFSFGKTPAKTAKERLKMVIIQDRALLSPNMLDQLRKEIIAVINRYLIIEKSGIEISIDSTGTSTTLTANIPIKQVRRLKKKAIPD